MKTALLSRKRIAPAVGVLFVILVPIYLIVGGGAELVWFYDSLSCASVLIFALAFALATSFRDHSAKKFFKNARYGSLIIGVMGLFVGIVSLLRTMWDADNIGTSVSTMLISAFYGIVFATIFYIIEQWQQ